MRELSYRLSFNRLIELSTKGIKILRGSTPRSRLLRLGIWALVGVPLGAAVGWLETTGVDPYLVALFASFSIIAIYTACVVLNYRNLLRRIWEGANGDRQYSVTQDSGGLRFATEEDEFYVKWHGITRMWLERDGVVVARGPVLLWIADTAFVDATERLAVIREIFARMTEEARLRSAHYLRDVLADDGGKL